MTPDGMAQTRVLPSPAGMPRVPPLLWSRRGLVVGFIFLATLIGFFDRINISVLFAVPAFEKTFGLIGHPVEKGELVGAFTAVYGLSAIFLSPVADWLRTRTAMLIVVGLWTVVMGASGLLGSFVALLVFRGLLGLAEGPEFSAQSKWIKRWFPLKERARANALWSLGIPLGLTFGFPLTVALTGRFGWRASFFAFALASLVLVLPLIWFFGHDRPSQAARVASAEREYIESGLAAEESRLSRTDWLANLAQLVRLGPFWLLFVFSLVNTAFVYGLTAWLPSYLVQARHFSLQSMGIYASLPFVGELIGILLTGYIEDKWRRAPVCLIGFLGAATCVYLAVATSSATGSALWIAAATFCFGAVPPTVSTLAQDIVPAPVIATGVGISNGLGNFFASAVPILMGAVIARTGNLGSGLLVLVADAILGAIVLGVIAAYGY